MDTPTSDTNKPTLTHALQERRYRRGLDGLYRISDVLISAATQQEALAEVLDVMASDLDMHRSTVLLVSPDGKELVAEVAHGLPTGRVHDVRYQFGVTSIASDQDTYNHTLSVTFGFMANFAN